jgi:serine/threonine-protein kinase ATR
MQQNIFHALDYLSRWLQAKRKQINEVGSGHSRSMHVPQDYDELKEISLLSSVEAVLSAMPADIISRRAVHCRSYARALLHWEQHIRQELHVAQQNNMIIDMDDEFRQLQDIYARIDEPDGVEGMSTRLQILDPEQQILEHKRAGRWTAAQSWYELALTEKPDERGLQVELLTCLKSSNRFGRDLHEDL